MFILNGEEIAILLDTKAFKKQKVNVREFLLETAWEFDN